MDIKNICCIFVSEFKYKDMYWKISENFSIDISLVNPNLEFCLGIYNQKVLSADVLETEEINDEDWKEANRLTIGFLLFNINFIY